MHWSYCSLALSHQYDIRLSNLFRVIWRLMRWMMMVVMIEPNLSNSYLFHETYIYMTRVPSLDLSSWKTFIPRDQYHGCWCPGDTRRQAISSHDIYLVPMEYSGFSIRRVGVPESHRKEVKPSSFCVSIPPSFMKNLYTSLALKINMQGS